MSDTQTKNVQATFVSRTYAPTHSDYPSFFVWRPTSDDIEHALSALKQFRDVQSLDPYKGLDEICLSIYTGEWYDVGDNLDVFIEEHNTSEGMSYGDIGIAPGNSLSIPYSTSELVYGYRTYLNIQEDGVYFSTHMKGSDVLVESRFVSGEMLESMQTQNQ